MEKLAKIFLIRAAVRHVVFVRAVVRNSSGKRGQLGNTEREEGGGKKAKHFFSNRLEGFPLGPYLNDVRTGRGEG